MMSFLLTDPKELERKEDKEIAQNFVKSLENELKNKKNEEVIPELIKEIKNKVKEHPYLVGLIIGIILAKYSDISKELDK